ncbi:MAG: purine-nucleoside phosphorylase [Halarsenatibacteraceae bacterium]
MTVHIGAEKGEIAETVLLPGDPLRAKYIAENYFDDLKCYNEVRGMYGYTGYYKGKRVSAQGSGMGMPSLSIYVNELVQEYGVKKIMRVGSCGAISERVNVRDVILAIGACSNSKMNDIRFAGQSYSPTASYQLLQSAYQTAEANGVDVEVGNIYSSDMFYQDDPDWYEVWKEYGVLAVEMETAELYTLAARHNIEALSILTVSDSIVTGEETTSEEREKTFTDMMEIALEIA